LADDEKIETEVRKWLRQQSKDLFSADYDVLLKGWQQRINVDGGYVEK
jgi:ABC-type oligopeptide transport system substrate-binding subunit